MHILNTNFFKQLIERSEQSLNQNFNYHKDNYSKFNTINSYIIDRVQKWDRTNLLITTPTKDSLHDLLLPTIFATALPCLIKNSFSDKKFEVGDILVSKQDGRVLTVKEISESSIRILPLGTTKRINLDNPSDYVQISSKYTDLLIEVKFSKSRIKNFESTKWKEKEEYSNILSYFNVSSM